MSKRYLNPKSLYPTLQYGFSQIVTSTGGKTVYLSGMVGWDAEQNIVGDGDLRSQTWQSFRNIETAMKEAGGALSDVVSMRIYIVERAMSESEHVSEALQTFFSETEAPASTWIVVSGLANENFLIEIEAIGVIDEAL